MTPYLKDIFIPTLFALNRQCGPIKSRLLADLLGLCERTVRYYLLALEQIGLVIRPFGKRSGWIAAQMKPR